jgi:hypothetical protein
MEQSDTTMKSIGNDIKEEEEQEKQQQLLPKSNSSQKRKKQKQIDWRRDKVFELSAKGHTQSEISRLLDIPKANICRDIQYLKKLSQEFVFDLTKDLGFYYKGCLYTMDQIQQRCWNIFNDDQVSQKDKLLALKIIKETCESKFSLIEKGPSVMSLKILEDRVKQIELSSNDE